MTTRVMKHPIAIVVGVALAALVTTPGARAFDGVMPVPPGGPHIFAPGPRGLGLQGPQANPSSVGDFDGTVALAYLKATRDGRRRSPLPHAERHAHHERRLPGGGRLAPPRLVRVHMN